MAFSCIRITFFIYFTLAQVTSTILLLLNITSANFSSADRYFQEYTVKFANMHMPKNSSRSAAHYSRQLPPKVVGGVIGGGLGGGIGGAVGGGVGYLVGGPIGGGVGGAIGGGGKGTGGLIGGKIGGGNGAAIGAGVGGAIGGGIGGFLAGPFGGGLGGLLGGGTGGGFGAAYLPDRITHQEDVPGFPKMNITLSIISPDDTDAADKLPFESKLNFVERLKQRISSLRLLVTNSIKNRIK